MQHLRGNAIRAWRSEELQVDVLGEDLQSKAIEVYIHLHALLYFLGIFACLTEIDSFSLFYSGSHSTDIAHFEYNCEYLSNVPT